MSSEKVKGLGYPVSMGLLLGLLLSACLGQFPSDGQAELVSATASPSATPNLTLAQAPQGKPQSLPITAIATIGSNKIELEVARTLREQATGLMYRSSLAPNRGMLFPFNTPQQVGFWMKNCLISLDMVFIRQGKVVGLATNVPPCKSEPCPVYPSPAPIDQVLELAAGRATELGIKVGDPLPIKFLAQPKSLGLRQHLFWGQLARVSFGVE